MSGQQRQRERWRRTAEGTEERKFNAATRLAENTERGRNGTEVWMQRRQTGLRETAGAVRRPAGAKQHSAVFNQDQKAT